MYQGYVESAEQIEARKARIMHGATVKASTGGAYQQALRTASLLLQAKIAQDARNKKLCVCLQYIGDNGPCPVHGTRKEGNGKSA